MSLAPSSPFPLLSVRSGWHCAVACGVLPSTLELMVAPLALQMEFCESACTLGGWWGNREFATSKTHWAARVGVLHNLSVERTRGCGKAWKSHCRVAYSQRHK